MDGWTELFKYIKDPTVLVLIGVIGMLIKLLFMKEKNMADALDKISRQGVILAELTTLVKTVVYRKEVE